MENDKVKFGPRHAPVRSKDGHGKTVYCGMGLVLEADNSISMYLPTPSGRLRITQENFPPLYKQFREVIELAPQS
jgi:hypothetical protein